MWLTWWEDNEADSWVFANHLLVAGFKKVNRRAC